MTTATVTQEPEVRESAAQSLGQAALDARAAGWTRPELAALTGLTVAQVWRVEQGRVHADEFDAVDAALAKIAKGEVQPKSAARPVNPLQARLDAVQDVIAGLPQNATKAQLWEALAAIQGALHVPSLEAEVQ